MPCHSSRQLPAQAARTKLLVGSVLALSGAVGAATAQEASSSAKPEVLPRIRVETDVAQTPNSYAAGRTSSATRTDTPLRDVPQSITVLNASVIADQGMHGMADAVRYVPGITMGQGEGNRDQPTIRGNGTTADFFLDGIRDDVQYFRDLYNVERVEALKGPNAMIFGRGGGGGVINRVTKQAEWQQSRQFTAQAGSFDQQRVTLDVGQGVNDSFAVRLNTMYEDSGSYRDHVELERYGINPTVTLALGERTVVRLGYEYFSDERTADRGIPSYNGRPFATDEATFFGDPDLSYSDAAVNVVSALIEHETGGGLTIRNRTRYADYDKFYQNVFPGAVAADGASVSISAYNNATERENLFNQTDVIWSFESGALRHTLLAGVELGRQQSGNFRNTGYFNDNDSATSFPAPTSNPTIAVPLTFRQGPNDPDSDVDVDVAAVYLQDQVQLSQRWQAIVGLRYDNFSLDFTNNRDGTQLSRDDDSVSPRAGLIYKPVEPLSLYASYSFSFLPSSGDQFSSLNVTTRTLEPDEFENLELGAKWDVTAELALTAAVFQLDRSTTLADPNNVGQVIRLDSQRTQGFELGVAGALSERWQVLGGYAYQDAETRRNTTTVANGAKLPLTPENTLSLWNRYDLTPTWGIGLGVIYQDEMLAALPTKPDVVLPPNNEVVLPSFTRVDAAVFFTLNEHLRAQLNVENLLDEEYHPTAHNNNNISPGSPTAVRFALTGSF